MFNCQCGHEMKPKVASYCVINLKRVLDKAKAKNSHLMQNSYIHLLSFHENENLKTRNFSQNIFNIKKRNREIGVLFLNNIILYLSK